MRYSRLIFLTILVLTGILVFQDGFRNYFTHEILSCYIIYFTFAHDYHIPECFYSNAFGHFPEYFPKKGGAYRPLLTCSLALDYNIYGLHALGYHVTNYVFHVINAYLVYLLAKYFFKRDSLAMVCSALFFLHPWNSSPMIILIQRAGLMHTSLYVSAVLCFIKYRIGKPSQKKWLAAAILCALGTVLVYEMYISLPAVLLSLDLFLFKNQRKQGWIWFHAGMFIALILVVASRFLMFQGIGGYSGVSPKSHHLEVSMRIFDNYFEYIVGSISQYIPRALAPEMPVLVLIVTIIAAIFIWDKRYFFLASWVLFAPVPVINMNVSPYYFYLASIGFILFFVGIWGNLIFKIIPERVAVMFIGVILITVLFIQAGSIRTEFNQIYRDNLNTEELVESIHAEFPSLPINSRIYMVIPQLVGRDHEGRNYYDISLEHLLQLKYKQRRLRCFPLPVVHLHPKYSNPEFDQPPQNIFFLRRVGNRVIQYSSVEDVKADAIDK